MKNAYKSELDPNNKQITAMRQHVGAARWVYNWGLERIKQAAANGERWPSAVDLHREVNKLKGEVATEDMTEELIEVATERVSNKATSDVLGGNVLGGMFV